MGDIKGTGTFNDDTKNNGNADNGVFNDNATNNGDIQGTGVFTGNATNNGDVKNGKFSPSATNNGTVETNTTLQPPLTLINGKWKDHTGANANGYYMRGKIINGDIVPGDNVVVEVQDSGIYVWFEAGKLKPSIANGGFTSGLYIGGIPADGKWYALFNIKDASQGGGYMGYFPNGGTSSYVEANGPFKSNYFSGGFIDSSYNNRTPQAAIDSNLEFGPSAEPELRFLSRFFEYVNGQGVPAAGGYTNGYYNGSLIMSGIYTRPTLLKDRDDGFYGWWPVGRDKGASPAAVPYTKGYFEGGFKSTYTNLTPQVLLDGSNNTAVDDIPLLEKFWAYFYNGDSKSPEDYHSNFSFGEGVEDSSGGFSVIVLSDGRIHLSVDEGPGLPPTFYYYSSTDGSPSSVETLHTVNIPPTAISWTTDPTDLSDYKNVGDYYIAKSPVEGTILWGTYEYATTLNSDSSYILPDESYVQISELGNAYWFDRAGRPPIPATKTYISLGDVQGSDGEYSFAYRSEWPPMGTHIWGPAEYQYRLNS